jgi:hypothetical protein
MLQEVKEQRASELVFVEYTRMGPNYWIATVTGKNMIARAVAEQMIREGARVHKIFK